MYVGHSATELVTLTNTGTAPLNVSSISTTGSATFTVEPGQCASPIAPLGTCDIEVVFTPTADGDRTGTLHVNSDGGNVSVALEGVGLDPVAVIDPTEGDFGTTTVVGNHLDIEFTVTNTGTGTLTFDSITTTGSGTFSVVSAPDCDGALLTNGEECTLTVRFAPNDASEKNGTLKVVTNGGTLNVPLTGQGVAAPAPHAQLSPADRDYGDVEVDTTKARNFTLTNTGTANLTGISVVLPLTGSPRFTVTDDNCTGVTLTPGQTCLIEVTFAPNDTGHRSGSITVNSNANTVTSTYEGTGVTPPSADAIAKVTPDEWDFGNETAGGSASSPKDFVVKNIGGGTLDVGTITVTGSSAFDIDSNGCASAHLDADETCTVAVTF